MTAHTLQTLRLILRPWRTQDLNAFANLNADPDVRKYFPTVLDRVQSDAEAERIQAHFAQYGYGYFAVEAPGVADFIGMIGLAQARYELPGFGMNWIDIGWRLARPYWSQGYALEGARAVVDYAFRDIKLQEIIAFTTPNNRRSRKLMERLGMTHHPFDDFLHPALPGTHEKARHVLYRLDYERWWAQAHHSG
jgi:RimJ/RimL family protein N-acetyltransferase